MTGVCVQDIVFYSIIAMEKAGYVPTHGGAD